MTPSSSITYISWTYNIQLWIQWLSNFNLKCALPTSSEVLITPRLSLSQRTQAPAIATAPSRAYTTGLFLPSWYPTVVNSPCLDSTALAKGQQERNNHQLIILVVINVNLIEVKMNFINEIMIMLTFPHTSVPVFINKKHPVPYLCKERLMYNCMSFLDLVILVKFICTYICVLNTVNMYV